MATRPCMASARVRSAISSTWKAPSSPGSWRWISTRQGEDRIKLPRGVAVDPRWVEPTHHLGTPAQSFSGRVAARLTSWVSSTRSTSRRQPVRRCRSAPAHTVVQQAVTQTDHANADETSWREGSRKPWLWFAVTAVATLFMIQYGRGKHELRALLGATFAGLVTSGRLSA
jgi:hypothetical protein